MRLAAFLLLASTAIAQEAAPPPILEQLKSEAAAMMPLVESAPAKDFLGAAGSLPRIEARTIYRGKDGAITAAEFAGLAPEKQALWKKFVLDDRFYWTTRYGSPLAFTRTVELAAQNGFAGFANARVADFGFGSVGQLRLMAGLGAHAAGIEVDPVLKALYSEPGDTGAIGPGHVSLHFGSFPGDATVTTALGTGYDLFVSKNTLKRGYIHPDREADKRMLIDLGVSDEAFVGAVHAALKPGGLFLIYNLCPPLSKPDEKFIPWSDGRSPFSRETYEKGGFDVLAFDKDDSEFAHRMGAALGWGTPEEVKKEFTAMWTLARKK